jgi:hypothetical protein
VRAEQARGDIDVALAEGWALSGDGATDGRARGTPLRRREEAWARRDGARDGLRVRAARAGPAMCRRATRRPTTLPAAASAGRTRPVGVLPSGVRCARRAPLD